MKHKKNDTVLAAEMTRDENGDWIIGDREEHTLASDPYRVDELSEDDRRPGWMVNSTDYAELHWIDSLGLWRVAPI